MRSFKIESHPESLTRFNVRPLKTENRPESLPWFDMCRFKIKSHPDSLTRFRMRSFKIESHPEFITQFDIRFFKIQIHSQSLLTMCFSKSRSTWNPSWKFNIGTSNGKPSGVFPPPSGLTSWHPAQFTLIDWEWQNVFYFFNRASGLERWRLLVHVCIPNPRNGSAWLSNNGNTREDVI